MEKYILADPSGNITALVESPVAPELRAAVAREIMAREPRAEQLGFISAGDSEAHVNLYMAGGEFCGNACLCAGAWYLERHGETCGRVTVNISGAEKPVTVDIRKTADCYEGVVDMPLPTAISSVDGMSLVSFHGISHLIAPHEMSRARAEAEIVPLCRKLGAEALGLMLFDREKLSLNPLVYVPGASSLFWENSCASGSSAIGAALAAEKGESVSLSISQPGGALSIEAIWREGALVALRLGGSVRLG